jgi:hypothetical protein
MGVVNRVIFPLAHIGGKWFAVVWLLFVMFVSFVVPLCDKISNPRIRTGSVIRWVAKAENVFVFPDGEAFDFAEVRVYKFFAEFLGK